MEKAACVGTCLCPCSSVCLSFRTPFFFFLSSFLPLSFPLSTVLGFNHCCNWQLPAVQTHTHTLALCLAAANPSGNVQYVCVLWGQERERYGEIRIMKEGEFQNCRPTHQHTNLSAVKHCEEEELCSQIVIIWEKKDMAQDLLQNTTVCWSYWRTWCCLNLVKLIIGLVVLKVCLFI